MSDHVKGFRHTAEGCHVTQLSSEHLSTDRWLFACKRSTSLHR